jgi:hypothetical protein
MSYPVTLTFHTASYARKFIKYAKSNEDLKEFLTPSSYWRYVMLEFPTQEDAKYFGEQLMIQTNGKYKREIQKIDYGTDGS